MHLISGIFTEAGAKKEAMPVAFTIEAGSPAFSLFFRAALEKVHSYLDTHDAGIGTYVKDALIFEFSAGQGLLVLLHSMGEGFAGGRIIISDHETAQRLSIPTFKTHTELSEIERVRDLAADSATKIWKVNTSWIYAFLYDQEQSVAAFIRTVHDDPAAVFLNQAAKESLRLRHHPSSLITSLS